MGAAKIGGHGPPYAFVLRRFRATSYASSGRRSLHCTACS